MDSALFQPIDREGMKTRMLAILKDLVFIKSAIEIEEVGPILERHLGLSPADMEEVMERFRGEMRDMFANHPMYPGSQLAKALDEESSEEA
jgi:hypothetical protein